MINPRRSTHNCIVENDNNLSLTNKSTFNRFSTHRKSIKIKKNEEKPKRRKNGKKKTSIENDSFLNISLEERENLKNEFQDKFLLEKFKLLQDTYFDQGCEKEISNAAYKQQTNNKNNETRTNQIAKDYDALQNLYDKGNLENYTLEQTTANNNEDATSEEDNCNLLNENPDFPLKDNHFDSNITNEIILENTNTITFRRSVGPTENIDLDLKYKVNVEEFMSVSKKQASLKKLDNTVSI